MKITIEYCDKSGWSYNRQARSLRGELYMQLESKFDEFNVELIKYSGEKINVFEVEVNDHLLVFSKRRTGRFPNSPYEVIKTINDAIDEKRLG